MVIPAAFAFNQETAESNAYQKSTNHDEVALSARKEAQGLANQLLAEGVQVWIIDETDLPLKNPDAVFPNNWIGVPPGSHVYIYPMLNESRRKECQPEIISQILAKLAQKDGVDFRFLERENLFCEGTGSLVFDHINQVAFAVESPRTHHKACKQICDRIGYELHLLQAADSSGKAVYHTNVVMCIGTEFFLASLEMFHASDQKFLKDYARKTNRVFIEIDESQTNNFAGNMLEINSLEGKRFIAMSSTAFKSLSKEQKDTLFQFGFPLMANIPIIEQVGGGSVRCMLAEVFMD